MLTIDIHVAEKLQKAADDLRLTYNTFGHDHALFSAVEGMTQSISIV
jgi:hypothetical protein